VRTVRRQLEGTPAEVVDLTTLHALQDLKQILLES
jgi:hypothetical protein